MTSSLNATEPHSQHADGARIFCYNPRMAHIHEKIDFTTSVYIVHAGKVLLRMHDKYHMWSGPGGHVDLHEDPNQAAVRECKEEVGLDGVLWEGMRRRKIAGR